MTDFIDLESNEDCSITDQDNNLNTDSPAEIIPQNKQNISAERIGYLVNELSTLIKHTGYNSQGYTIIKATIEYLNTLQGDLDNG